MGSVTGDAFESLKLLSDLVSQVDNTGTFGDTYFNFSSWFGFELAVGTVGALLLLSSCFASSDSALSNWSLVGAVAASVIDWLYNTSFFFSSPYTS